MTDEEPFGETLVCRRWSVKMPERRAQRPGWSYWEIERLSMMHVAVRPGDVVWEIGGEQGDVTVLFALWGADVVVVEPDCAFWPNIKRIFEANGVESRMVGGVHAYVDRTPVGGAEFAVGTWPSCVDGTTVGARDSVMLSDPDGVPHVTLDQMLGYLPAPDVVSVDIDGAEYQMLLGADRLLHEVKPILFISVHPDHLWDQHKDTPDDVWHHLELHGYEPERLGRDHEVHVVGKPKP